MLRKGWTARRESRGTGWWGHLLCSGCTVRTPLLPKAVLIWYDGAMTTKEIALKTIEQLPESASWEDIQERINFIVGVRKGLSELDEGQGIPHDKVKEEFAEWLAN